jgi:FAD/FMN-containing dehydrogenase
LHFDPAQGTVTAEAGITWPDLVNYLLRAQEGQTEQWSIAQKQTGADRLCLGGALSANIHGRGLRMKPLIADVESFDLIDAQGQMRHCSRTQNSELFRLAVGGYGLFGVIYSVTLRLMRRQKLQRVVEITTTDELMSAFNQRIRDGFVYGDFQFMTDEKSKDFLRRGVFSCYRPVDPETPIPKGQKEVSERAWNELVYLAHADKAKAYQLYADYYLSTSGQFYWSDIHQLGAYLDNYHQKLDRRLGAPHPATEVITEIYIPRASLSEFIDEARADFLKHNVNVIYGTIRLIEQDKESFLAWAKQPYACVIFNLHTEHTPEGKAHSAQAFRRLIDMAIRRGGSYYLTYHRHATRKQVESCYPQFARFLQLKKQNDPQERFQSDWYRHYKKMFAPLQ